MSCAGKQTLALAVTALLMTVAVIQFSSVALAGVAVDCDGTNQMYADQGIPCRCVNGQIVCDEGLSGGSSSSKKPGLSYKNQMKLELMQSITDMAADAFIRWINDTGPAAKREPTPEERAAAQAKLEREKAEWQARIQRQFTEMEARYSDQERQEVKAKSSRLLANLKGLDEGSPGGQSELFQQLRCKAHWGHKAATEKDLDLARQYSQFAENPDASVMDECKSILPEPALAWPAEIFRIELYQTVVQEINQRLPLLEEAKKKQQVADTALAEKTRHLDQLQTRKEQATSAENQQTADDLLAAALQELDAATALQNEAEAGVMKLQLEVDVWKNVETLAVGAGHGVAKKGALP